MKHVIFCLGLTDERPLADDDKFVDVALVGGTRLLIPILWTASGDLKVLRNYMRNTIDDFFDGAGKDENRETE